MTEHQDEDQGDRDTGTPPRLPLGQLGSHERIKPHLRKRAEDQARREEQGRR